MTRQRAGESKCGGLTGASGGREKGVCAWVGGVEGASMR